MSVEQLFTVMPIVAASLGGIQPPRLKHQQIQPSRKPEVNMFGKFSVNLDDMALALVLWLCTLPLVGLFIVPFFGLKVAAIAAIALFIAAMSICWGICGWKLFRDQP